MFRLHTQPIKSKFLGKSEIIKSSQTDFNDWESQVWFLLLKFSASYRWFKKKIMVLGLKHMASWLLGKQLYHWATSPVAKRVFCSNYFSYNLCKVSREKTLWYIFNLPYHLTKDWKVLNTYLPTASSSLNPAVPFPHSTQTYLPQENRTKQNLCIPFMDWRIILNFKKNKYNIGAIVIFSIRKWQIHTCKKHLCDLISWFFNSWNACAHLDVCTCICTHVYVWEKETYFAVYIKHVGKKRDPVKVT
jgi:hypothetical protein